jgi:type IV pilus assembly protein PilY1
MNMTRTLFSVALSSLLLVPSLAHPEDIDLYTGGSSGGDTNVLIVLDNESNWGATMDNNPPADADTLANCGGMPGSYFCAQKYALITLLQKTDATGNYVVGENVGIGLMMYGNGANKGGYIRFGVRRMTPTNRAALIKLLKNMPVDDKGSSQQDFGYMMWEAFKYFGGGIGSPWSSTTWGPIPLNGVGTGTDKRDYPGSTVVGSATWAGADTNYAYSSSSTALTGGSRVQYVPLSHTSDCGKNYIIYVGHSDSQSNINNNQDAQALFIGVGGSATQASPGAPTSGDEGARYLFNSDVDSTKAGSQNVITYTIGAYAPPATGQVASMITSMKSMARQGGGSYYDATSISKLADDFGQILTEIQGINSVFVSASLPISANTQGTFLNQVFVGMFRPDASGSPKWLGNVKQYQLKYDSTTRAVRLADADGLDAIDAGTGFVSVLARSYWTTSSTFWTNWVPAKTSSASDSKDGPEVQKGGAAQRQREANLTTQASRPVYTCAVDAATGAPACVSGAYLSATPFDTTTLPPASAGTQAAFGYPSAWTSTTTAATDLGNLVAWTRGTDNLGNEGGPGGSTTVRPSIHGDVLHSRPVALNYGGSPARVVVFYGANDGMLRAIEGKQSGTGAGNEMWAFVAPDLFGKLNRLRDETPKLVLPSNAAGSIYNKSYFMDGPIGAYQEGSTAIIYVAARRGGNFIYAIDVSNPDAPKFKFRLSPSSPGLSNLGQTWSMPKVTKVRDGTSGGRLVLVMGGGYDTAEDSGGVGTTGRGVYVIDALTGAVIKHFLAAADGTSTISTSIPSDVTIVNVDRDDKGFADRAYVGDLAGNVWRMDLDDPSSSTNASAGWKLYKLASLGAKKFFYPPDVVLGATFHAVLIGSGDREKPLATSSSDAFYMIKDAKIGLDGSGQTTITTADLVANTADSTSAKGWYYNLNTGGEKVVNAPLTVGGVVYFGTNKPIVQATCKADLGESRSYAMSFLDGSGARAPGGVGTGDDAYSEVLSSSGLPPSPVAGLVDIGGVILPVCLGCGERRSAFEAGSPPINPSPVRRKIYWKFKNDK